MHHYDCINYFHPSLPHITHHDIIVFSLICRHPESSKRPSFSDLYAALHEADSLLLEWSEEEKAMYSENARTIGAAFQEGELLHKDLHKKYEVHY